MDSKKDSEAATLEPIDQTADVQEGGNDKSHLKISDIVNTSLEDNDKNINPVINFSKEQSLQTAINETEVNIISVDKRDDLIGKEPFSSDIVTPSKKDGSSEITNVIISPEQYLDGKLSQDNDMKLFPDDESCSDMQDEEIQLRWDDDDINLDCVDVALSEEKKNISKDINNLAVEDIYLENIPEKLSTTSSDIADQIDRNIMDIDEKNVSQYKCQEDSYDTECEKINTQQDDKHLLQEYEQGVNKNKCNEIAKQDECLTILIDQSTAQVENDKNITLHKCEDIAPQQENMKSQPDCKESVTENIIDKIDQQTQEKNVMEHESEQVTSELEVKNNLNQNERKEIVSPIDSEKSVTKNKCVETTAIVVNEDNLTQIETKTDATPIDNDKSVAQKEHEEIVTLIDNVTSDSQHASEEIVTKGNKEKNINKNDCEKIVMQDINEKDLIQQVHEEISVEIDNGKKEIKSENDVVMPQVDEEKSIILSKCKEITTQHGLKKPDMMLEIPTQELIDFMDEDEPDLLGTLEMSSDEAAIEISHDTNSDVNMSVINDAVTVINMDVEMENIKSSIECEQKAPNDNEKNQIINDIKAVSKNQLEVCPETISLLGLKQLINKEREQNVFMDEPQPSTSKACMIMEMRRDSDEVGEVSDSLGLLAESTRVLEDDEEQDDEDDADDDYDYDQYEESSNQMGAEFSEDSNAVNSETDIVRVTQMEIADVDKCKEKEQTEIDYIVQENESCGFHISDIKTQSDDNKDNSTDQLVHSEILIAEDRQLETEEMSKTLVDNINDNKDTDATNIPQVDQKQDNESLLTIVDSTLPSSNDAQESNLDKEEIVLLESSSDEELSDETENILPKVDILDISKSVPDISQPNASQQTLEQNSVEFDTVTKNDSDECSKQKLKSPRGLEVFSIDSDDDDNLAKNDGGKNTEDSSELCKAVACVNIACRSSQEVQYYVADAAVLKYYEADRGKKAAVCEPCAEAVFKRNKELIEGIKNNTPLLELNIGKQIVEISDSDSEKEEETIEENNEKIGEAGAKLMEEQLAEIFNTTWQKFNMDARLDEAQTVIRQEMSRLEKESQEINQMLNECQSATDKLRNELYATFEQERKTLAPIVIFDTDYSMFCDFEDVTHEKQSKTEKRASKRKSVVNDVPTKKPLILSIQNTDNAKHVQETKTGYSPRKTVDDDNVDVSVVKLSVESAPADLPQPGEVIKQQLRTGMTVYAMRNNFGIWLKAKIIEIQTKNAVSAPFTMCRLKFEHKVMRNAFITLPARCIAFEDPPDVRLTIGTRVIASSEKNESFYSGVVAEVPNPVNNYRYLVFFDDGHAKYARHANTRLVCECSPLVWEEVHPNSRDFVRQYLLSYPERPMVRLHPNQNVKTEWNGKWWNSRVLEVDASLALILLAGDRMEWIYRGSTRLGPLYLEFQAAERQRSRPMPRSGPQNRTNMPYVEYTRYDEPQPSKQQTAYSVQQNEEIRRQRAVAKKSTVTSQLPLPAPPSNAANLDNVTSRVVYYTPKNAIRPHKMVPHQCGPKCKRTDVLALKDLRTYNPLAKPLLSAWERQIVRFKGHKEVMYRAPCGRRLRNMEELHRYLRAVKSDMPVDLFDFGPSTHCLAEFVLNKCIVGKKDLSHGKENVPVPCVNYYDDSLPEFCSYNTERTPTAGVPLNLDTEFLCGCDCDDDCKDKTKCGCWKMTLEGARTIGLEGDVGYVYRRLPDPLPSGIYECNSRCKCKNTCLNRVAQHPLQLKLQVFKTLNRGWGIRALNDVPKGAFLCVYAGNLLTDATANLDGLNEGDEYLAELDYIEVVEQMKEGYEEDIPESLREPAGDKKSTDEYSEDETSSSEEEDLRLSKDERDDDFRPGFVDVGPMEFNKRLRTREKRKKEKPNNENDNSIEKQDEKLEEKPDVEPEEKEEEIQTEKYGEKDNVDDDFITISDDEEVREPSRFTAQTGMDSKHLVSKYRSVRSYFGKDEACYIMDAKVQGNIGRYLNHSCCPNVFVQNVFVDTHDPRFPWVAFFALSHIRAGTELTWNYNYDVGSVPGKVLYCYCGAANCRGRLL